LLLWKVDRPRASWGRCGRNLILSGCGGGLPGFYRADRPFNPKCGAALSRCRSFVQISPNPASAAETSCTASPARRKTCLGSVRMASSTCLRCPPSAVSIARFHVGAPAETDRGLTLMAMKHASHFRDGPRRSVGCRRPSNHVPYRQRVRFPKTTLGGVGRVQIDWAQERSSSRIRPLSVFETGSFPIRDSRLGSGWLRPAGAADRPKFRYRLSAQFNHVGLALDHVLHPECWSSNAAF
jgi:hypothetical protein